MAVVWGTHRKPDTNIPEVYDPFCRGVMAANPDERTHWLDVSTRVDAGFAPAYKERAIGYLEKGRLDLALGDYSQAINAWPDYAEAYAMRASTYTLTKDYDRAWSDTRKWRQLGGTGERPFLPALRKASGRTE